MVSSNFTVTPLSSSGFSGVDCSVSVRPLISALTEVFDIPLRVGESVYLTVWVTHGVSLPSGDAVSNRVGLAHPVTFR